MAGAQPLPLLSPQAPPAIPAATPPAHWALKRLLSRLDSPLTARLATAGDLARARSQAPAAPLLPSPVSAIEALLGQGLARGELVELMGDRASGRFALVLELLAATTAAGENAALVDLGDGLDPQGAAAAGIELARLLWLRPRFLREALAAAEVALTGGFPLVALELGSPPIPGGRGAEAAWLRLARTARLHQGALLLGAPYRVSGPAAAAVVRARRGKARWQGEMGAPRLLAELGGRLEWLRGRATATPHPLGFALTAAPKA